MSRLSNMFSNRPLSIRNLTRRSIFAKASSVLAISTVLALGVSQQAHAQAFEGMPTVQSGGASFDRTTPGQETIFLETPQTVINWTTNDTGMGGGDINFLPSGHIATFTNDISDLPGDFTVLNRIIPTDPTRAVNMDGNIISQIDTGSGSVSGGSVWFYSPGGLVIGSNAIIDVGSLVLTTADPFVDVNGDFLANGTFSVGPAVSDTRVTIQPGASIVATAQNSYVVAIAPIVQQGGDVDVDGSVAYIGAESATITMANGLFDVQITQGTDATATSGTAITHTGVTSGRNSTGPGDFRRIYLVSVPKNDAITTLVTGGSLGFDVAGAANVEGNAIVLSTGYDIFDATSNGLQPFSAQAFSPDETGVIVSDTDLTSATTAQGGTFVQFVFL